MGYLREKTRYVAMLTTSVLMLICLIILAATVGAARISFFTALKIAFSSLPFVGRAFFTDNIDTANIVIITGVRLPRIFLSCIVGAGLSLTGTVLQSLFRNPMAESGVLGISSGAALGAAVAILLGINEYIFGLGSTVLLAFIFALLTVVFVYRIALIDGRIPAITLLLSGIAVGFICNAIIRLIMSFDHEKMAMVMAWTMGSFNASSWTKVITILPVVVTGVLVMLIFAKDLNVISTGEDTAKSLGIDIETEKKLILAISSVVTAACVSVSGIIGFVGLVVPHIIRLITGPDHRVLLPFAVIWGAIFMLFCDTLARTVAAPMEIPVGIITALFGAPFFVFLLVKNKRKVKGYGR